MMCEKGKDLMCFKLSALTPVACLFAVFCETLVILVIPLAISLWCPVKIYN